MLLECVLFTTNKELHKLIRGTFGVNFGIASRMLHKLQNLVRGTFGRHQETPESMHASGTSGPSPDVATQPNMGIRQELLDRLLHVTTEPSS